MNQAGCPVGGASLFVHASPNPDGTRLVAIMRVFLPWQPHASSVLQITNYRMSAHLFLLSSPTVLGGLLPPQTQAHSRSSPSCSAAYSFRAYYFREAAGEMASLSSIQSHAFPLSPFLPRTGAPTLLPCRTHLSFSAKSPSPFVARLSLGPGLHLPGLESAHELFERAEGLLYTIADAAVSSSDVAAEGSKKSGDWLSGITDYLETVLKVLKNGLAALHVPYSYGFAIILLTILMKGATFPLTKKQIESAMAMRSLQPQVKAIHQRYAGDQERIQLETARLYKLAGVNPLAGCLPTLVTIPVWIGLYRALSNVANEGLLTEGFFWIPSLAGPTTIAARQSGGGTSWLFPFVDGHPPLGWSDTLAYLVLPALLIISQYVSAQIMQPSQASDPRQNNTQVVTKLLPLMIGYFALSVPSGLSLYWFTNNILSMAQQIWLQKLGGATNPVKQFSDPAAKDEQSNTEKSTFNIQKSLSDLEIDEAQSSQAEKENSGGLRRGERFKQIKEEEEKRRKQREEERRKAAEASRSSQTSTEQQHQEVTLVESKNEQVSEKNQKGVCLPSGNNAGINGNVDTIIRDDESPHEDVQKHNSSQN